ncbi:hypothetical protein PTKIN_Ptkin08bG0048300 [Pterospermum kingtungense]
MASPVCHNKFVLIFLCIFPFSGGSFAHSGWNTVAKWQKPPQDWLNHGGDLYNRRYAEKETRISPETVSRLRLKWEFYAGKDITATPAISKGTLYFPSWNGNIYAVKASDGSLVWEKNLHELTGLNGTGFLANVNWTVARATPTIADDLLIIGISGPAIVISVKRLTGELVWSTQLDNHAAGVITTSGTYYKGYFYVGTSSQEESLSIEECCTFRGSFAKLDARSGKVLWQTFTLPDNFGQKGEYAGGAIWGSSPSIDITRNHVYVGTGNLYSAPLRIRQCQEAENNQTVPTSPDKCIEPENHSNSILALDLETGEIKWYRQLGGYDVWFLACINLSNPNCPPGPNPDADFSEAPMMLSVNVNGTKQDIVVAAQKSGFAWALSRDNGSLIWSTEAGPGGTGGGAIWGAATDKKRVYTNIANSESKNFTLKPSTTNTTAGGWVAMDAATGEVLWSTADPSNATASGPVTIANGVLFAGSTYKQGPIYAFDAENGKILWSYDTGATVYGGMSVSNGCIYLGNGSNGVDSLYKFLFHLPKYSDVYSPFFWRFADKETKISPATVSRLRLKWKFNAGRDISATPVIFEGTLYFPSWDGYLYAVKALDGMLVWKQNLQQLTGLNSTGAIINVNVTASRTTPAIADDLLIFGLVGPAYVVAVKRSNGKLVWSTQLDKSSKAVITMSGTYYKGHFYVGTSSLEETLNIEECCVFRGSFAKLNARTGKILWQTYMLPENFGKRGEYAGAAIWGSSPSIDVRGNHVYIATGNLYSAPKNVTDCHERQNNQTDVPTHLDECVEPENLSDSILALDLDTGKIKWYNQLGGYDVCEQDHVVAVQKSGFAWALSRDNGHIIWSTNFTPRPSTKVTTAGGWVAMDARSGQILWSTADPSNAIASGPVTVANGILFGGSTFRQGPIYAMDANTGKILWSYNTGATIYGGLSVSNGCIYIGHGYKVSL